MKMVFPISKIIFSPFLLYIKKIEGRKNLPKGPFIVAANHSSYLDDLLLPWTMVKCTNNYFHIYVNSRYYKNKLIKGFLDMYKMIPVDVKKDVKDDVKRKKNNKKAFDLAVKYLKKGHIFLIFPEGSRGRGEELLPAKHGVAKIALTTNVPVVPIGIIGTDKIYPKGAFFPRFKRAIIKIGQPLYFESTNNDKDYEQVTDEIMKSISKLCGKKYGISNS